MLVNWCKGVNFGDEVTPYLVEKMGHTPVKYRDEAKYHYMFTGSILGEADGYTTVWGAGISMFNQKLKKPKEIRAVRGWYSAERLRSYGIKCPDIFGDPALLLPRYYKPEVKKIHKMGVVPHLVDYITAQCQFRGRANVVDVTLPVERVIDEILSCDKIISSSLHGLIVAHTYGIPALWVEFSDKILGDGIKYWDYFTSVEIEPYEPLSLRNPRKINEIIIPDSKIEIDLELLHKNCPI